MHFKNVFKSTVVLVAVFAACSWCVGCDRDGEGGDESAEKGESHKNEVIPQSGVALTASVTATGYNAPDPTVKMEVLDLTFDYFSDAFNTTVDPTMKEDDPKQFIKATVKVTNVGEVPFEESNVLKLNHEALGKGFHDTKEIYFDSAKLKGKDKSFGGDIKLKPGESITRSAFFLVDGRGLMELARDDYSLEYYNGTAKLKGRK